MDLIMYDAQRQGRLSFYMVCKVVLLCSFNFSSAQVSAGEEGIAVGSASALTPDDVVFAQYRETGVFQQRGFTLDEFMSQLFANSKDVGRGRNMPVHYGSSKLHIVFVPTFFSTRLLTAVAHDLLTARNTNPPGFRRRLRSQTPTLPEPYPSASHCSLLLWRRRCVGG